MAGVDGEAGSSIIIDSDDTDDLLPGFKDANAFSKVHISCPHFCHTLAVDCVVNKLFCPESPFCAAVACAVAVLLFVWNTLTVSMTVSTTIPLHQDPLGVDVAGLQGMQ